MRQKLLGPTKVLKQFCNHAGMFAYCLQLILQVQNGVVIAGEGNGTPLQYSCLENPMDEGAW